MTLDAELEVWRREWQSASAPAIPGDLRKIVERRSRFMRLTLLLEVTATLLVGGGYTLGAILFPGPGSVVLVAGVWALFAVAWVFATFNRRGIWRPEATNTRAFLDISLRRSDRRLTALNFCALLYALDMMFCMAWIFHYHRGKAASLEQFLSSVPAIVAWICTAAFAGFIVWQRGKTKTDLVYLQGLQRQLEE